MAMQVFYWGQQSHTTTDRTYYKGFSLNGSDYTVGDCVYLFPEDEHSPPYIGRITSAFINHSNQGTDPHCIEVKWFERRVNLEPGNRGMLDKEKEVVELEEVDVNPIGCISGKCHVVAAKNYDEAFGKTKDVKGDWFFCRGVFKQLENSFVLYREVQDEQQTNRTKAARNVSARLEDKVADSEDVRLLKPEGKRARTQPPAPEPAPPPAATPQLQGMVMLDQLQQQQQQPAAQQQPTSESDDEAAGKSKAVLHRNSSGVPSGVRLCVECGATNTPQWREGPAGPKTLCNACGVRYVRAQQRASKRAQGAATGAASVAKPNPGTAAAAQPATTGPQLGQKPTKKPKVDAGSAAAALSSVAQSEEEVPSGMVPVQDSSARPVRQAAVLAANRTATFARTGIFPASSAVMAEQPHLARTQSKPSPTSNDSSHHSTDSGEEGGVYSAAAGVPLPALPALDSALDKPLDNSLDSALPDTPADHSLLPMSVLNSQPDLLGHFLGHTPISLDTALDEDAFHTSAHDRVMDVLDRSQDAGLSTSTTSQQMGAACFVSVDAASNPVVQQAASLPADISALASRAVQLNPAVEQYAGMLKSQALPQGDLQRMAAAIKQMETAASEATAADLAVQAATKLLEARQAQAERAHAGMQAAAQQLQECLASLAAIQGHTTSSISLPPLGVHSVSSGQLAALPLATAAMQLPPISFTSALPSLSLPPLGTQVSSVQLPATSSVPAASMPLSLSAASLPALLNFSSAAAGDASGAVSTSLSANSHNADSILLSASGLPASDGLISPQQAAAEFLMLSQTGHLLPANAVSAMETAAELLHAHDLCSDGRLMVSDGADLVMVQN